MKRKRNLVTSVTLNGLWGLENEIVLLNVSCRAVVVLEKKPSLSKRLNPQVIFIFQKSTERL